MKHRAPKGAWLLSRTPPPPMRHGLLPLRAKLLENTVLLTGSPASPPTGSTHACPPTPPPRHTASLAKVTLGPSGDRRSICPADQAASPASRPRPQPCSMLPRTRGPARSQHTSRLGCTRHLATAHIHCAREYTRAPRPTPGHDTVHHLLKSMPGCISTTSPATVKPLVNSLLISAGGNKPAQKDRGAACWETAQRWARWRQSPSPILPRRVSVARLHPQSIHVHSLVHGRGQETMGPLAPGMWSLTPEPAPSFSKDIISRACVLRLHETPEGHSSEDSGW